MTSGAWIEVDLAALVHNAGVIRRAIPAGTRLGLLVKANGYGHGMEMAARAGLAGRADQLMVASLAEGLALRGASVDAPILVVYPIGPDGIGDAVEAGLELSIGSLDLARRTLDAWRTSTDPGRSGRLTLHLEIDTGMGRGGIEREHVVETVRLVDETAGVRIAGFWSHLSDGADPARSREQVKRFESALAAVAATGRPIPIRHLAATEGVFCGTAPAYDMVRVGLGFYGELGLGIEPSAEQAALADELRPAMAVKARPVRVERVPVGASVGYGHEWTAERPSLVATLPIGYADGWTRLYWPGASALVHGCRVPLVGRVSMDSVCADVTDAGDITIDDEFVLLGSQGGERITADELAALRRTVTNEVLCALGPRLPRVYVGREAVEPPTEPAR